MAEKAWYNRVINRYTLSGATLIALYFWWRKRKNDNIILTAETVTISIDIPKQVIAQVCGDDNINIRDIAKKADTIMTIKQKKSSGDYVVEIVGESEKVAVAESMLQKLIQDKINHFIAVVKIPNAIYHRFMGRHGVGLRRMCLKTGACITLDPPNLEQNSKESICTITGNLYDVLQAQSYVESRRADALFIEKETRAPGVSVTAELYRSNSFQPIYVTAIESPSAFWIQPIGRERVYFEKLQEDITKFYNADAQNDMDDIRTGDFCAYYDDNVGKWYRVKLVDVKHQDIADVLCLDYGDTLCDVSKSKLKFLCPEFRMLQFQAVKCALANVESVDERGWSKDAIDCFRQCVYFPNKIELYAAVVDFQSQPGEVTSFPLIELIDTSKVEDVNINYELVKMGYAECVSGEYVLEEETISPLSDINEEASLCQMSLELTSAVSEISSHQKDASLVNVADSSFVSLVSTNVEMQEIAASFDTEHQLVENGNHDLKAENLPFKTNNQNGSMRNDMEDSITEIAFRDNSNLLGTGHVVESSPRKSVLSNTLDTDQNSESSANDFYSFHDSTKSGTMSFSTENDPERINKNAFDGMQDSVAEDGDSTIILDDGDINTKS